MRFYVAGAIFWGHDISKTRFTEANEKTKVKAERGNRDYDKIISVLYYYWCARQMRSAKDEIMKSFGGKWME